MDATIFVWTRWDLFRGIIGDRGGANIGRKRQQIYVAPFGPELFHDRVRDRHDASKRAHGRSAVPNPREHLFALGHRPVKQTFQKRLNIGLGISGW